MIVSVWYIASVIGICLSIWAIFQLAVMGNAYARENVMLVDDVEPLTGEYNTFEEYLMTCESNYKIVARNCFLAAYVYVWVLAASVVSFLAARFFRLWLARRRYVKDEVYCEAPKQKKPSKKKLDPKQQMYIWEQKAKTHTS